MDLASLRRNEKFQLALGRLEGMLLVVDKGAEINQAGLREGLEAAVADLRPAVEVDDASMLEVVADLRRRARSATELRVQIRDQTPSLARSRLHGKTQAYNHAADLIEEALERG